MKAAGKEYEYYIYEKSGHAFMNETRPEMYNEEDAKIAAERLIRFAKMQ